MVIVKFFDAVDTKPECESSFFAINVWFSKNTKKRSDLLDVMS